MKITLLTHQRELNRKTNTGSLAASLSEEIVDRVLWERLNPNKELLESIKRNEAALLYPSVDSINSTIGDFKNIIIIDGTWQEAQKIYNKSPYLKIIPKVTLETKKSSAYKLRRNQPEGGLCTIECVIEVLKIKGLYEFSTLLEVEFERFNK